MRFTRAALQNTDRRVQEGKSVTPMFLLGVFLWMPIKKLAEIRRSEEKMSESQSLASRPTRLLLNSNGAFRFRSVSRCRCEKCCRCSRAFESKRGKRAMKLLDHRRFRAAYDFMLLLSEVGHGSAETASSGPTCRRSPQKSVRTASSSASRRGRRSVVRRRRRRKKPAQDS